MAVQGGAAVAGVTPSRLTGSGTGATPAQPLKSDSKAIMADLKQELLTAGPRYSFIQLIRLLERWSEQEPSGEMPKVLFRPMASLAFQASEIAVVWEERAKGPDLLTLETPWLGLYGPGTPLPLYYTEDLLDDQVETQVLRGFLDVFNHRAHELLSQIWQKYRCHLRMRTTADDPVTEQLASLARLSARDGYRFRYVDRRRLLPLTGMLSFGVASASVMERVLRYYFDLPGLYVLENVVTRVELPDDQHNCLGLANVTLGDDLALGTMILDCSSQFEIRVEQVDLATAQAFHPGREAHRALLELVDFLAPNALDVRLRFQVAAESIPLCQLGDGEVRLGLSCQLGGGDAKHVELLY